MPLEAVPHLFAILLTTISGLSRPLLKVLIKGHLRVTDSEAERYYDIAVYSNSQISLGVAIATTLLSSAWVCRRDTAWLISVLVVHAVATLAYTRFLAVSPDDYKGKNWSFWKLSLHVRHGYTLFILSLQALTLVGLLACS